MTRADVVLDGVRAVGGQKPQPQAEDIQQHQAQHEGGDRGQEEGDEGGDGVPEGILLHRRLDPQGDAQNRGQEDAEEGQLQGDDVPGPDLMEGVLLGHVGDAEIPGEHVFHVADVLLQEGEVVAQGVVIGVHVLLGDIAAQNHPPGVAWGDVHHRVDNQCDP